MPTYPLIHLSAPQCGRLLLSYDIYSSSPVLPRQDATTQRKLRKIETNPLSRILVLKADQYRWLSKQGPVNSFVIGEQLPHKPFVKIKQNHLQVAYCVKGDYRTTNQIR